MIDIYDKIAALQKQRIRIALCTIVKASGSTPQKEGHKLIVDENGMIYGTVGGGELEKAIISDALKQLETGEPLLKKHDLLHQHNMCCGGQVEVFIEPIKMKKRLYIFGAGHVGKALAKYTRDFDFETFIIDDRKEYVDAINFEGVNKMNVDFNQVLKSLPFDDETYIVILTYSHPKDRDILSWCLKQPFEYCGMIGSLRKVEMTKKNFIEAQIATSVELEKIDMPIGESINAIQPEEIAISILSKLIKVKNKTS